MGREAVSQHRVLCGMGTSDGHIDGIIKRFKSSYNMCAKILLFQERASLRCKCELYL